MKARRGTRDWRQVSSAAESLSWWFEERGSVLDEWW